MLWMILGWMILCVAAAIDIRKRKIPVVLIIASGCLAVLSSAILLIDRTGSAGDIVLSLLPGAGMVLLSAASRGAVGIGDGLLIAAIGPVYGFQQMTGGVLLAFFFSAVGAVVLLLCRKATRKSRIPFVPFLATAMGVMTFALQ